ncbi:MAG: ABC transporter permease [Eubacteriales bacterium]|nr:ABC transporter permease [Christensenellaceae bacterium]MDY2751467.1 ABC transporter permease [Eubacteriales bacterium]
MRKAVHEPVVHLVKRVDMSKTKAWLIRIGAFLLSILACAIITTAIIDKDMSFFFKNFFGGTFGTPRKIWNLFHETALLLLVALAVTPCFKMKFWNIGGEGQILMGALGCAVIVNFMGGKASDAGTIVLSLLVAVVFSALWSVIPALFKARWNTNETLLTLMMNYIATCLTEYFIKSVASTGTGTLTFSSGVLGSVGGNEFILKIIVAAVITVLMYVYLRFSKHGYELTVVGESENTARYIGINSKIVIIRTMLLCGVIAGITGFLLVSATNLELHSQYTVNGRGFTGVLISWLAHFNPIFMSLTSFLVVFVQNGAKEISTYARLGTSFPAMLAGIFFFFIIASEFFINYKIMVNKKYVKLPGFLKRGKTETVAEEDK